MTQYTGTTDKVLDVYRYTHQPLDAIFAPRSVAVIGATEREGSVGRTILWNLITNSFGGTVFPVNLKRPNVLGNKAYPDILAVPDEVDLAVIVKRMMAKDDDKRYQSEGELAEALEPFVRPSSTGRVKPQPSGEPPPRHPRAGCSLSLKPPGALQGFVLRRTHPLRPLESRA